MFWRILLCDLCSFLCSPYDAIRFFGLQSWIRLTIYPTSLEAVLRAEVALFAEFLAVWTLQRARVLVAVLARALARGVYSHRVRKVGIVEKETRMQR